MIDFSTLQGLTIPEGTVTEIKDAAGNVLWSASKPYLTFSSPNSFTISVTKPGWDGELQYSNDTTSWTTWDGSQIYGTALYLRGIGNTKITPEVNTNWTLSGTDISCSGRIDNLLDYQTVRAGQTPTMANNCYYSMFYGCTGLTTAPALPATTLVDGCYSYMFIGCTGLTTAPELPATTLANDCYYFMFYGCTGLTTAPALPATTLVDGCYYAMFYGCTGLTTAPALPATTLVNGCYHNMFGGCTGLTTAPALPATTLANNCYRSMFYNCTGLTTAPALPATTLVYDCYHSMFNGCTNIKLSETMAGTYTKQYRIPTSGTITADLGSLLNMFDNTGGTFTGTPSINTTYYLDQSCSIV